MIFLQLIAFGAIALVLTFSLGYIILRAATNLTVKECLALAGACGIALQGAVAFIGFLLGLSGRTFFLFATAGLFTIAIALLLRRSARTEPSKKPSWLYLLIVFWITLLGIQLFVPIYSGAFFHGDWWMHYDIAQVYLGKKGTDTVYGAYTVTSRTPLFNLFSSYYLGLLGNKFSIYQLSSILPGCFLLATITLLIRPGQVTLAVILVAFNPYMNTMMIYPWPKVLASLYVVAGIYFYLDLRKNHRPVFYSQSGVCCGISWGLAILSHQSTVLYVAAMIADNIWIHRSRFANVLRQLSVPLFIAIGLLLPWLFWGVHEYGFTEFFLAKNYYSLAPGSSTLVGRVLDAIRNAIATLVPSPFFGALTRIITTGAKLEGIWNPWFRFYYDVLPGTLTITMSCLLISGGVRQHFRKKPLQSILPDSLFWAVIVIGFFGGCILQPGFNLGGIVGESMTPIVFLLLLVAIEYLYALPIKLRQLMLLMVTGEFFISRGLHLVFLGMGHSIIWDGNVTIKIKHSLVFARDLIGTRWPALMVPIWFIILWSIGFKASSIRQPLRNNATNGLDMR